MSRSLNAARWKKIGGARGGWPISEARYSRSNGPTCTAVVAPRHWFGAHMVFSGRARVGAFYAYKVVNPDGTLHWAELAETERGAKTMAARTLRACGIQRG